MITTEERDSLLVLLQAHAGAPGCWYETITKDRARELIAALTREPAPSASACQCRELLREAATHVHCDHDSGEHTCIALKIDAALAQPCAAPGEAGEWSEAGLVTHKFKAHYDVAGSCTEPLSNIAQDGDYIRVYEPRYRRRAPEREGGAR